MARTVGMPGGGVGGMEGVVDGAVESREPVE